jgi:O-6-methylguanine DNA methyltransferase
MPLCYSGNRLKIQEDNMYYAHTKTPAGTLLLTSNDSTITGMHWVAFRRAPKPTPDWQERPELFVKAIAELTEYFAGKRTTFDIPLSAKGTAFQQAVWKELQKIPYGETTTYSAIASAIGRPKAVRAVGTAVGSNPISIAIPCHRVIAANGTLGGYAGGLESKQTLFTVENIASAAPNI